MISGGSAIGCALCQQETLLQIWTCLPWRGVILRLSKSTCLPAVPATHFVKPLPAPLASHAAGCATPTTLNAHSQPSPATLALLQSPQASAMLEPFWTPLTGLAKVRATPRQHNISIIPSSLASTTNTIVINATISHGIAGDVASALRVAVLLQHALACARSKQLLLLVPDPCCWWH